MIYLSPYIKKCRVKELEDLRVDKFNLYSLVVRRGAVRPCLTRETDSNLLCNSPLLYARHLPEELQCLWRFEHSRKAVMNPSSNLGFLYGGPVFWGTARQDGENASPSVDSKDAKGL